MGIVIAVLIGFAIYMIPPRKRRKDWQHYAGSNGERLVAAKLAQLDGRYKVYNDVHYRGAQIDHIVEGNKMVFVIETKNWAGNITGKYNSRYWVQNGTKQLYNPIRQNAGHCRLLRNKYSCPIISVIVFVGTAEPLHIKGVIRLNQLLDYIEKYSVRVPA